MQIFNVVSGSSCHQLICNCMCEDVPADNLLWYTSSATCFPVTLYALISMGVKHKCSVHNLAKVTHVVLTSFIQTVHENETWSNIQNSALSSTLQCTLAHRMTTQFQHMVWFYHIHPVCWFILIYSAANIGGTSNAIILTSGREGKTWRSSKVEFSRSVEVDVCMT